jgi:uncharacterized protein GlcG (DUF336 family)
VAGHIERAFVGGTAMRALRHLVLVLGFFGLASLPSLGVHAQTPPPLSTPSGVITLAAAQALIQAAEAQARALNAPETIVITDGAGQIVAVERMDGVPAITVTIVHNKAFTAAQFGAPTHVLAGIFGGNPTLMQGLAVPGVNFIGGGYPVMQGRTVIGAIGVGGGTEAQDMEVAEAALAKVVGPP